MLNTNNIDIISEKIKIDNEQLEVIEIKVDIYIPDNIGETTNIVIFLPGFDGNPQWYRDYIKLDTILSTVINNENIPPFISIVIDPTVLNGSSFYVNSKIFGKWEDFISTGLLRWAESYFKKKYSITINDFSLIGHSMGGFASLYIGLQHSDIFSKVASISGLITVDMIENWKKYILNENVWFNKNLWDENHFFTRLIYYIYSSFEGDTTGTPFTISGEIKYELYERWKLKGYDIINEFNSTDSLGFSKLYLSVGRYDIVVPIKYFVNINEIIINKINNSNYIFKVFDGDHINGLSKEIYSALKFFFKG